MSEMTYGTGRRERCGGNCFRLTRHTRGATETATGEALQDDQTDNRLPLFPDRGDDVMTLAEDRGGVAAAATSYGN